jgi:hypothetical protein
MCSDYNYENRVQEQARREEEEEAAEQRAAEEAMEAPAVYDDEYLRENGQCGLPFVALRRSTCNGITIRATPSHPFYTGCSRCAGGACHYR